MSAGGFSGFVGKGDHLIISITSQPYGAITLLNPPGFQALFHRACARFHHLLPGLLLWQAHDSSVKLISFPRNPDRIGLTLSIRAWPITSCDSFPRPDRYRMSLPRQSCTHHSAVFGPLFIQSCNPRSFPDLKPAWFTEAKEQADAGRIRVIESRAAP